MNGTIKMNTIYEYVISHEANMEVFKKACDQSQKHVHGCMMKRQATAGYEIKD